MRLKPGDVLGKYQIEREVGHGGMASVYRAYQPSLQIYVAIKVLPEFLAGDRALRERFAREAATLAQLRHPNIVRVFDYAEEDDALYIVMDFVDGETLAARLARPLSTQEAIEILRPVAQALDYAHAQGVLHRDVKPSNIMLTPDGDAILTDFGLARMDGSWPSLTDANSPVGTAQYIAPEEWTGGPVTGAIDRYALAIVAFEMLTGSPPFDSPTPTGFFKAHVHDPVPRASIKNPALPLEADEVMEKALEKHPEDRYDLAVEFVEALTAALSPPPVKTIVPSGTDADVYDRPSMTRVTPFPETPNYDVAKPMPDARSKAVVESLQYPPTLAALTGTALSAIYLALLAPILGYGVFALLALVALPPVAVAGFILRYPREHVRAEELIERSEEQKRQDREDAQLSLFEQQLREGFVAAGSPEGLKALTQLTTEFALLRPDLGQRRDNDPLSMSLVPSLAVETYRRGLSVLGDAQELVDAIRTSGADRLREEVGTLEREIAAMKLDPSQTDRQQLKENSLALHRDRLRSFEELRLRADQLFFQAQRCEASLNRTRMDLLGIRTGSRETNIDSVITRLQRTIDQAKAIQAEIRRLGY